MTFELFNKLLRPVFEQNIALEMYYSEFSGSRLNMSVNVKYVP